MAASEAPATDLQRISYPGKTTAWGSAVIVFILTTIAMADRLAISMLIGPIKADFGIGDFQASLLIGAAFTLFYTIFLLPIGWAADRFSRSRVLMICLIVWSIGSVASGLATGFIMLFLCRMLVGAGEAGLAPSSHGIIGASFPREQLAKPLALQSIGMQVGGALGIFAAGAILTAGAAGKFAGLPLVGDLEPWRLAFIFIGLPGLLAVILVPLIHDPTAEGRRVAKASAPNAAEQFVPFMKSNGMLVGTIILASGFSAIGFGSVSAWSPEFLLREYGISPAEAGAKLGAVMLVAATLSQLVYSSAVDFFAGKGMLDAPVRIGLLPVALAIPVAYMTYNADSASAFLAWQFALLCCIVPCGALANTCTQQVAPPALRSRLSSILILVISIIGFGVGPSLVGWLSEFVYGEARLGDALTVVMMTAMTITLTLLVVLMGPLRRYTAAREQSEGKA